MFNTLEYEVLYYNDDGSAKVRMTINGSVLEQDFATDTLDTNVKEGMAIFQAELLNNVPAVVDTSIIGEIVKIAPTDLPIIPAEDFLEEQPLSEPLESSNVAIP